MPSMAGWTSAEGSQFQLGQQAVCSRLFTHTTLCHGASHHRFKFNNLRHWKALLLFHWTNVGDYPSALAPCWGLLLISSPSHQEGIWCLSPQLLIGHQIHRCAPSLDCVNLNRDVLVMIQIYSFFFFVRLLKADGVQGGDVAHWFVHWGVWQRLKGLLRQRFVFGGRRTDRVASSNALVLTDVAFRVQVSKSHFSNERGDGEQDLCD